MEAVHTSDFFVLVLSLKHSEGVSLVHRPCQGLVPTQAVCGHQKTNSLVLLEDFCLTLLCLDIFFNCTDLLFLHCGF